MATTPSLPSVYTQAGWIVARNGNALQPRQLRLSYTGPTFALDGRRYAQRRKERGEPPASAIPPLLIAWIIRVQPAVDALCAALDRNCPDRVLYHRLRGRVEASRHGLVIQLLAANVGWTVRPIAHGWVLTPIPAFGVPLGVLPQQLTPVAALLATHAWSPDTTYTSEDGRTLLAQLHTVLAAS